MQSQIEYNHKGAFRFNHTNLPAAGTELLDEMGETVVFDEVGPAGMLACTRKSDGTQNLYFPHSLHTIGAGSGD